MSFLPQRLKEVALKKKNLCIIPLITFALCRRKKGSGVMERKWKKCVYRNPSMTCPDSRRDNLPIPCIYTHNTLTIWA